MSVARLRFLFQNTSPWSRVTVGAVLTGLLLVGCGGEDLVLPGREGPVDIRVAEGDGQSGQVGELLPAPIVAEVTDSRGQPVEGATVVFELTSAGAGADLVPSTVITDADGHARARMLLGTEAGLQTGEARLLVEGAAASKASFAARAISDEPSNQAPRADYNWSCENVNCRFTDTSTDADGSVTGWNWRFGDGSTSLERDPSHAYSEPGTYAVALTVTDDGGLLDESSSQVTVNAPPPPPSSNKSPQADFEVLCSQLTCIFTDKSKDDDGTVADWLWRFGDGAQSTERNPSRDYGTPGKYQVTLTVTDDDGASDTETHEAEPKAPPPSPSNKSPQAEFEVLCSQLTCIFTDKSKDDDGTVADWLWRFGDGAQSTERNPSHDYGTPGKYQVTLTVTDDDGASDTKTREAEPKTRE